MPSNKRKSNENIDKSLKKIKLIPFDPIKEHYEEVSAEIPNLCIGGVCSRVFDENAPNSFKFEIKSYKSEASGTAVCYCGEIGYIEECKVSVIFTVEKGKKKELEEYLEKKLPGILVSK